MTLKADCVAEVKHATDRGIVPQGLAPANNSTRIHRALRPREVKRLVGRHSLHRRRADGKAVRRAGGPVGSGTMGPSVDPFRNAAAGAPHSSKSARRKRRVTMSVPARSSPPRATPVYSPAAAMNSSEMESSPSAARARRARIVRTGIRQMAPDPSGSFLQVGVFDKAEPRRKAPRRRMTADEQPQQLFRPGISTNCFPLGRTSVLSQNYSMDESGLGRGTGSRGSGANGRRGIFGLIAPFREANAYAQH